MSMFRFALIALVLLFSACATVDAFLFDATPDGRPLARQAEPAPAPQPAPVVQQASPSEEALSEETARLLQEIKQERARLAELEQQKSRSPEPEVVEQAAPASQLWVKISFRSGQTELEEQSRIVLAKVAAKFLAAQRTQTLDIRSYSDGEEAKVSATGKTQVIREFLSAQELTAERADAVANALMSSGIPAEIIQKQGFGASNFVADNTTAEGRNKNRRVEIHLVN